MAASVLTARWLIDGHSDTALENGALVIRDDGILEVGIQGAVTMPDDAVVEDFGEATILPGLVDCHTHWIMDGSHDPRVNLSMETPIASALRAAAHASQTLRCGVTTVRDVGCAHGISIALREAIAAGLLEGPRVFACGSFITMTGGHGYYFGRQADGEDDVRRAVREQLRDGADLIKIIASGGVYMNREDPTSAQFTLEELAAAVAEARMAGVKVAMHAEGAASIENSIEVGTHTVEHGMYLTQDTAKAMLQKDIVLVPTIFIFYNLAKNGQAMGVPKFAVEKAREIVEVHRRGFEIALQVGVRIAAGTDVGGPLLQHHAFPLQNEIVTMVKYGMKPMDAIKSATAWAADTIGAHDFGTLQPGKLADVVVCEGFPLDDVSALLRLKHIRKEGRAYAPVGSERQHVSAVAQSKR
jgi:imidazolonepropionase-like amidohydrolase